LVEKIQTSNAIIGHIYQFSCTLYIWMHWRHQLWGTGARGPLDFQFFLSFQSRTNSDIGLCVVAYLEHIYRSISLSLFIVWIS